MASAFSQIRCYQRIHSFRTSPDSLWTWRPDSLPGYHRSSIIKVQIFDLGRPPIRYHEVWNRMWPAMTPAGRIHRSCAKDNGSIRPRRPVMIVPRKITLREKVSLHFVLYTWVGCNSSALRMRKLNEMVLLYKLEIRAQICNVPKYNWRIIERIDKRIMLDQSSQLQHSLKPPHRIN